MIQEICHFFPSVFGRPSSVWVAVLSSSYVAQIGPWPSKNWPAPAPSTIQLDQTLSKYRVRINGSSMVKHPEIKSRSRHFLGGLQYPLVIWHSHGKWPIEIDGLPIKKWWFSMAMLNNQMVIVFFYRDVHRNSKCWKQIWEKSSNIDNLNHNLTVIMTYHGHNLLLGVDNHHV